MTDKPNSRKTNVVVQNLDNEVLIYDLTINKAFCLNETSALVYQLADGTRTVTEISDLMSKKLRHLVSEDLIWLALEGLRKDNLLENADEVPNYFAGLSRREAIKKVGLASMVMLPVVSSLIAPAAATAASGCAANGAACTFSNNTQSNCCNSDQRCYTTNSSTTPPTCRTCFSASASPVASCQSAGCCNQRTDRNRCCSSTFNETQVGSDFVCSCA